MPTILDAFALVALAAREPAAGDVEAAIRAGGARMSAINLAETADQLIRARGHDKDAVKQLLGDVVAEVIEIVPVDAEAAWQATALRARHYHRRDAPLSLPDCAALALARETPGGRLATADRPLLKAADKESVPTLALPDSAGSYG